MQKLHRRDAKFVENAEDNMLKIRVLEECFLCVLRGFCGEILNFSDDLRLRGEIADFME
jgi:hypothetical protein